jgi:hypothetical protein
MEKVNQTRVYNSYGNVTMKLPVQLLYTSKTLKTKIQKKKGREHPFQVPTHPTLHPAFITHSLSST